VNILFDRQIIIKGKHAIYMDKLAKRNEPERVFNRLVDVYMLAPIVGYIYGKEEEEDNEIKEKRTIFTDVLNTERKNLKFIYQTLTLLIDSENISSEERMERAFKDQYYQEENNRHNENQDRFNRFLLGGITYLHDRIIKDSLSYHEQLDRYHDFVKDFQLNIIEDSLNIELNLDEIID